MNDYEPSIWKRNYEKQPNLSKNEHPTNNDTENIELGQDLSILAKAE